MSTITEANVEAAALDWLATVGWGVAHGPDITPDAPRADAEVQNLASSAWSNRGVPGGTLGQTQT